MDWIAECFSAGDRAVDRFTAWLDRLGPSGAVVVSLFAYGAYAALDLTHYVITHP